MVGGTCGRHGPLPSWGDSEGGVGSHGGGGVRASISLCCLVVVDQALHLLYEPGYVSEMEVDVIFSHLTLVEILVQLTSGSKRKPKLLVARFGNDTAHYLD